VAAGSDHWLNKGIAIPVTLHIAIEKSKVFGVVKMDGKRRSHNQYLMASSRERASGNAGAAEAIKGVWCLIARAVL
jgi:hypothetical protein